MLYKSVVKRQQDIPKRVGKINAKSVHFMLLVSFFIVNKVVEQGQCIREKRIVFIAVKKVQPFAKKRFFISSSVSASVIVPRDI